MTAIYKGRRVIAEVDLDELTIDTKDQALEEIFYSMADEGIKTMGGGEEIDGNIVDEEIEVPLSPETEGLFFEKLGPRGYTPAPSGTTKDQMLGDREVSGFNLVIEHEAGDQRFGRRLPADYGFIRNTTSAEGTRSGARTEGMDVFVGKDEDSSRVFVIDSYHPAPSGQFDEHKIFLGYASPEAALSDFWTYYFDRTGVLSETSHAQFRDWLEKGDTTKPYSQPTDVHYTPMASKMNQRCQKCKYFEGNVFCSNPDVQRDPKVPQSMGGIKIVSPTGWCKEFKKKPQGDLQ